VRALETGLSAEVHQGSLAPQGLSPIPLGYQPGYSKHSPLTVSFKPQVQIIR
jgi:hypothetical protein